jgi:hypothetical protein
LAFADNQHDYMTNVLLTVCRSEMGFCVVSCVFLEFMRLGRTQLIRPLSDQAAQDRFRRIWRAWSALP